MKSIDQMSWDSLYDMRLKNAGNRSVQNVLAPYEHRAWARERVSENPLLAPAYSAMIPGYYLYKQLGRLLPGQEDELTSDPQASSVGHGLLGVVDGLMAAYRGKK